MTVRNINYYFRPLFEVVFSPVVSAKGKSSLNAMLNSPAVLNITWRTCTTEGRKLICLLYVTIRTTPSTWPTLTLQLERHIHRMSGELDIFLERLNFHSKLQNSSEYTSPNLYQHRFLTEKTNIYHTANNLFLEILLILYIFLPETKYHET